MRCHATLLKLILTSLRYSRSYVFRKFYIHILILKHHVNEYSPQQKHKLHYWVQSLTIKKSHRRKVSYSSYLSNNTCVGPAPHLGALEPICSTGPRDGSKRNRIARQTHDQSCSTYHIIKPGRRFIAQSSIRSTLRLAKGTYLCVAVYCRTRRPQHVAIHISEDN